MVSAALLQFVEAVSGSLANKLSNAHKSVVLEHTRLKQQTSHAAQGFPLGREERRVSSFLSVSLKCAAVCLSRLFAYRSLEGRNDFFF